MGPVGGSHHAAACALQLSSDLNWVGYSPDWGPCLALQPCPCPPPTAPAALTLTGYLSFSNRCGSAWYTKRCLRYSKPSSWVSFRPSRCAQAAGQAHYCMHGCAEELHVPTAGCIVQQPGLLLVCSGEAAAAHCGCAPTCDRYAQGGCTAAAHQGLLRSRRTISIAPANFSGWTSTACASSRSFTHTQRAVALNRVREEEGRDRKAGRPV